MLVRSYAKINLTLAVSKPEPSTAARPGWHRIASWFHAVDMWDEVHLLHSDVEAKVEVLFASGVKPDWPMEKDLGYRAIKALEARVGRALPVLARVTKRIPAGGGLGGGSSNAAAVLRGVNQLLGLGLDHSTLVMLGRELGSDVEFFLDDVALNAPPRAAFVQGFGDHVERVRSLNDEVTLLVTGIDCPTSLVYQKFDALGSTVFAAEQARHALDASLHEGHVREELLFNQLTSAACEVRPALNKALHACARRCGQVLLSGSGGTIFTFGRMREAMTGITPVATRLV